MLEIQRNPFKHRLGKEYIEIDWKENLLNTGLPMVSKIQSSVLF